MSYLVYGLSTPSQRSRGTFGSFVVSDKPKGWDDYEQGTWKPLAEFHISQRNTEEEQRKRAHEYCEYMNSKVVLHPPIGT